MTISAAWPTSRFDSVGKGLSSMSELIEIPDRGGDEIAQLQRRLEALIEMKGECPSIWIPPKEKESLKREISRQEKLIPASNRPTVTPQPARLSTPAAPAQPRRETATPAPRSRVAEAPKPPRIDPANVDKFSFYEGNFEAVTPRGR